MTKNKLILASSSPTRFQLLSRLTSHFETIKPEIDEAALSGETPKNLVSRLAKEKAQAVLDRLSLRNKTIIASDQVMAHTEKNSTTIFGKTESEEEALRQLMRISGTSCCFYTSLYLIEDIESTRNIFSHLARTQVNFRKFNEKEAQQVILLDQPMSCAGSFRSEGLGISLCDSVKEDEPGALMGLPLVTLAKFLRQVSFL